MPDNPNPGEDRCTGPSPGYTEPDVTAVGDDDLSEGSPQHEELPVGKAVLRVEVLVTIPDRIKGSMSEHGISNFCTRQEIVRQITAGVGALPEMLARHGLGYTINQSLRPE